MSNLELMVKARTEKALTNVYRYDKGIMTVKQYLDAYAVGFSIKQVGKIDFNRTKFNRFTLNEQSEEYMKKVNEKKTVYCAHLDDAGLYLEIPKLVFDYYQTNR